MTPSLKSGVQPGFIEGDFDTTFVDREYSRRDREESDGLKEMAFIAAALRAHEEESAGDNRYAVRIGDATENIVVETVNGQGYRFSVSGTNRYVEALQINQDLYSILCDGRPYDVEFMPEENGYSLSLKGRSYRAEFLQAGGEPVEEREGQALSSEEETITAPMTCQIVRVSVTAGQVVEVDQELLMAEAMKLETPITSPIRGKVKEILVNQGQTVETGAHLVLLEPL
jgi:acetyl/propionyl-CoA carboxylase alpha subunit